MCRKLNLYLTIYIVVGNDIGIFAALEKKRKSGGEKQGKELRHFGELPSQLFWSRPRTHKTMYVCSKILRIHRK